MSCVVRSPNEDWLRGRLSDCREELKAAKVARTVDEIETEIGELEFLLGEVPA